MLPSKRPTNVGSSLLSSQHVSGRDNMIASHRTTLTEGVSLGIIHDLIISLHAKMTTRVIYERLRLPSAGVYAVTRSAFSSLYALLSRLSTVSSVDWTQTPQRERERERE